MGKPAAKIELDTRRTQWLIGDWHGLAAIDIAQLEKHTNRLEIALYLTNAQSQLGKPENAQATIEATQHWGVDQNTLAKITLSGLATTLSKASALLGDTEKMRAWSYRALCFDAAEVEARLIEPFRLMEQLQQLGLAVSSPESSLKVKQPDAQFTPPSEAILQKQKLKQASNYLAKNQTDIAEHLLEEILLEWPNSVNTLQELAKVKAKKKDWISAEKLYSHLLKEQTQVIKILLLKNQMLKNQDRLEEGVKTLELAENLGLYNANLLHQLAVAYRELQQWEQADHLIKKILEEYPEYSENQITFATFTADVLRKRKKIHQACYILKRAIDKSQQQEKEIPLITRAIYKELEKERGKSNYSREVSKDFYNSIYLESEKYNDRPEYSIYLPAWKEVAKILKNKEINTILDIGCGPGQFAEFLQEELPNIEYTGIDYSEIAISKAKERNIEGSFHVINFMENDVLGELNADLYIALEVFEHIENDLELIKSLPIGKSIIFSVPSFDSFGHVRFFKSLGHAENRYNKHIVFDRKICIKIASNRFIYIFSGAIKNGKQAL